MGGSGFTQTFAELDAAANRLSHLLRSAGLEPGDHIAICMENHDRYLEVVWGCHYAGLVYTCTSSRLQSGELEYILNDCEARAFITSQYKAEQAAEIVANTPGVELRLMLDGVIDGYESYEDAVAEQPVEPLEHRIAGTDMLYSSGTTGRPKGVKFPLRGDAIGTATPLLRLVTALYAIGPDTIYLSPAPLYHAAPLRFNLTVQRLGGTYSASPVFADGRIYFLSEEGMARVIAPGREFRVLATSKIDGDTLGSMAIANGSIFIRTDSYLYRIANARPGS